MRRLTRTHLALTALVLALALALAVVGVSGPSRSAQAQSAAQVEVAPTSGLPGSAVTLRGAGWPAGITLAARVYRESDLDGAGADLGMTFQTEADGSFAVNGTIPPTLFGAGSRGSVDVTPGPYTIVVRAGPVLSATTAFLVVPPDSFRGK